MTNTVVKTVTNTMVKTVTNTVVKTVTMMGRSIEATVPSASGSDVMRLSLNWSIQLVSVQKLNPAPVVDEFLFPVVPALVGTSDIDQCLFQFVPNIF